MPAQAGIHGGEGVLAESGALVDAACAGMTEGAGAGDRTPPRLVCQGASRMRALVDARLRGHDSEGSVGKRTYWLYMLASKPNGTLYLGVTNDLSRRVQEHRDGKPSSFATRYGVTHLVWYEPHDDIS